MFVLVSRRRARLGAVSLRPCARFGEILDFFFIFLDVRAQRGASFINGVRAIRLFLTRDSPPYYATTTIIITSLIIRIIIVLINSVCVRVMSPVFSLRNTYYLLVSHPTAIGQNRNVVGIFVRTWRVRTPYVIAFHWKLKYFFLENENIHRKSLEKWLNVPPTLGKGHLSLSSGLVEYI